MIPIEFQMLPDLRPPTPDSSGLWMVRHEWRAPALDSMQVVVRAATPMPDGTMAAFWTDGISDPRLFWTVTGLHPFAMPFLRAALPHDFVYAAELAPRAQCDDWMLRWAQMGETNWYQRNTAWSAVRAGGWRVWGEHTQHSIAEARKVVQLVPVGEPVIWEKL